MKRLLYFVIPLFFFASACKKETRKIHFEGEAQGTYYAVTYFDTLNRNLQASVDSLLTSFDLSASIWVKNSLISKLNRNESTETDSIFRTVFRLAERISIETNGAFDITVGPLSGAWGFGFDDPMKLDSAQVDSLRTFVGFRKVKLENNQFIKKMPQTRVDFNAIAQGYSVDLVGNFFESKGIVNYLIDIGGEVLAKGEKPEQQQWKVGIEKPTTNTDSAGIRTIEAIVRLKDNALATSGNYRKFYWRNGKKYSHTINPLTGYPVKHSLLSASILHKDCASADAYATSFMVMGLKESKAFLHYHPELQAFLIYSDENGGLKTWYTDGFKEILEEEN